MNIMEKFTIKFKGVDYNAVEIDGKYVSEDDANYAFVIGDRALWDAMESEINKLSERADVLEKMIQSDPNNDNIVDWEIEVRELDNCICDIYNMDEEIFGYADNELIVNGTEEEIGAYAHSLL